MSIQKLNCNGLTMRSPAPRLAATCTPRRLASCKVGPLVLVACLSIHRLLDPWHWNFDIHTSLTTTPLLQVQAVQKVSDLPPSLQKIVGAFQMVPDPMARYKQLLFYASKLPPMPAADHLETHKVQGCVSQVWIKPELQPQGTIQWQADSDSQLTKGLAALLVLGLSGCTPKEVLSIQPEFIEMLGLKQSLTPSRNNGFLNAFKLMQLKCLGLLSATTPEAAAASTTTSTAAPEMAVVAAATTSTGSSSSSSQTEKAVGGGSHQSVATLERPVSSPPAASSRNGSSSAAEGGAATARTLDGSSSHVSGGMDSADCATATLAAAKAARANAVTSSSTSRTPISDSIRDKLTEALQPSQLQIIDQSASHAGHAAMKSATPGKAGASGETHFRVEVVSEVFVGLSLVKRQRMVYGLLAPEFALGLHALSLDTRTGEEAARSA